MARTTTTKSKQMQPKTHFIMIPWSDISKMIFFACPLNELIFRALLCDESSVSRCVLSSSRVCIAPVSVSSSDLSPCASISFPRSKFRVLSAIVIRCCIPGISSFPPPRWTPRRLERSYCVQMRSNCAR